VKKIFVILYLILGLTVHAQQPNDCVNALVVCGNGDIALNVSGIGNVQEVNSCGSLEHKSLWIKITIQTSGTLGFTLTPSTTSILEDYDFWVFTPNATCGNLGAPIRCSTTNPNAAGQGNNLTGMNEASADTSEGPGADGNSFVHWLDVLAGEQYYICLDRPIGNAAFNLTWTGTATLVDAPVANAIPDLNQCDTDGVQDGFMQFDLNQNEATLIGGQPNVVVNYYTSISDATIGTNAIINVDTYINTSSPQTIYVALKSTATDCSDIAEFDIAVRSPQLGDPGIVVYCEDPFDGLAPFDLTTQNLTVMNGATNLVVTYYETSLADAEAGTATGQIANPTSYVNTANPQTLWARAEEVTDPACYAVVEFQILVSDYPTATQPVNPLESCDNGDGTATYDLTLQEAEIENGQTNVTTTYYTQAGILIDTPTDFTDVAQTITARVTNTNGCYVTTTFDLIVLPLPNTPTALDVAEYSIDSIAYFDFTNQTTYLLNGQTGITISYYETFENANTATNALVFPFLSASNPQTIYVRSAIDATGCYTIKTFEISVKSIFPPFFTPNGDTYNDVWQPIQNVMPPNSWIYIYDRFGKMIYKMHPVGSWNGVYTTQIMPASDYWFHAIQSDGREARGHFALKR
jgi:gliding motility-associated-like protein